MSEFDDDRFTPIPAALNSLEAMRRIMTDPRLGGWADDQLAVFRNPSNAGRVARELRELMRQTTGVLVLYYVGHGQLTPDGQLCLAVTDTVADSPDYLGLRYEWVATALRESPAPVKITILDCCYSGQAIEALSSPDMVADLAHVAGVYTLTATTRNRTAHVVPPAEQGAALTSFTGELVDLVESGIPGGPPQLTFGDLYRSLQQRLAALGLPRPKQRGTDNAVDFVFTRNAAAAASGARVEVDDPSAGPTPEPPTEGSSADSNVNLPAGLGHRYQVTAVLSAGGADADADVLAVRDLATGAERVMRLYRSGIVLDRDAAEGVRILTSTAEGLRHLATLHEVGVEDGRWYEVQERCAHGSLRSVMGSGHRLSPAALAQQLGQALAFLEGKVLLGNLRPGNLLVRALQPLDVVVGDVRLHLVDVARTDFAYLPPEAGRGSPTPAWDWWSVGIILAEVALGRHPLADRNGRFPSDREIFERVHYGTIDVSPIPDLRVRSLCTGLLRRDPTQRWGRKQVLAWIAGAPPSVH